MWQHYQPGEPLSRFVDCLWYYEGEAPLHAREKLLPSGEMELVINLHDDEIRTYGQDPAAATRRFRGAVVVGAHSGYFIIDNQDQERVMGVHFRPGGGFPFFGMPADEMRDQHVGLSDLWGNAAAELRERLLGEASLPARFQLLEKYLVCRAVRPLQRHPAVAFALREFRVTQGVAEVTEQTGLSARRFIQAFSGEVGLTPKLFCRVRRFQKLIESVRKVEHVDWSDTALACGYFDQAHFIHDFREFSGMTPSEYLMRRVRHSNHVPLA